MAKSIRAALSATAVAGLASQQLAALGTSQLAALSAEQVIEVISEDELANKLPRQPAHSGAATSGN